jgi:quercetin dioxygenase-like cupin family protein
MFLPQEDRPIVQKGWGWEDWIYNEEYCGKRLFFHQGRKCSWHFHKIKDEVLYLQFGEILLYYSDTKNITTATRLILKPNDAFHIKPGVTHRMYGIKESMIFEASTHHEDNDSVCVIKGD